MPKGVYERDVKGSKNPNWRGGRVKRAGNRIGIYCPGHPATSKNNPYVLEYRLIVEKRMGCYLKAWEVVHHLNGDQNDNRPENLEVLTNSQHSRFHGKGRKRK